MLQYPLKGGGHSVVAYYDVSSPNASIVTVAFPESLILGSLSLLSLATGLLLAFLLLEFSTATTPCVLPSLPWFPVPSVERFVRWREAFGQATSCRRQTTGAERRRTKT